MALYPVFTVNLGQAAGAAAHGLRRVNPTFQRVYPWLMIGMALLSFIPVLGVIWAFFVILLFTAGLIASVARRSYMVNRGDDYPEHQMEYREWEYWLHKRNIKVFFAGIAIAIASLGFQILLAIVGTLIEY